MAGAAGTSGATDATGTAARFTTPTGVVSDNANLFVADSGNHTADGIGTAARFSSPIGLTIENAGNLYVSDQNYTKVCKIVTSTCVVTTISATF